ncbi:serine hydrolase domain-containing protein [Streptomyces sp. NPDC005046]
MTVTSGRGGTTPITSTLTDTDTQQTPRAPIGSSPTSPVQGTNWRYSHANFVLLGAALEKMTGTPLDVLLQQEVMGPLGRSGIRGPVNMFAGLDGVPAGERGELGATRVTFGPGLQRRAAATTESACSS